MPRALMQRFAEGDPRAVRDLYATFKRPIFTVALSALGDRSLAEEAVQQTFLQAWRAAKNFDHSREPGPWLYAIARRVAVDIYRRERRHQGRQVLDTDTDVAALPEPFERTWEAWQVRRALDRMPADLRAVVEATHYLGLTHDETAQKLGIPIGTVKSRSHRAHRRLAGLLAHLEEASA